LLRLHLRLRQRVHYHLERQQQLTVRASTVSASNSSPSAPAPSAPASSAPAPSSVTLNPDLSAVQGWASAQFGVTANRDFVMAVSLAFEQCGSATFRIDTGNQGVSIADEGIAAALAQNAQGQWMSDGSLQVPSASWWQPPDLHFTLGTIRVTIPGHKWALKGGKSIFVRYHKNVLGLPFITAGDFYFADATKTVYFKAAGA
jgi:hypothetical protein